MTKAELLARIEAASGPDREIDAEVAKCSGLLVGDLQKGRYRAWIGGGWAPLPTYTASIDAALALVERMLPEWEVEVASNRGMGNWDARIAAPEWGDPETAATAPTAALAILAALLKALDIPAPNSTGGVE